MAIRHAPVTGPELRDGRPEERGLAAAVAVGASLLILAGAAVLMAIITAEAVFPRHYSTAQNAISDLGSTFEPGNEVRQPSATVFNTTMIVAGLMIATAGAVLRRALHGWGLPITIVGLGLCLSLVGVFPGTVEHGEPTSSGIHPVAALLTFAIGGLAAILGGLRTRPPFRYLSILLGAITFVSLILSGTLADTRLGEGGIERWVAYPIVIWLIAFGGYLLGSTSARPTTRLRTAAD